MSRSAPVREREIKLAAPPGFRLLDLGAAADGVVATAGEDRRLTTVYWDTPDLRLIRSGCTLRHRAGEGWTVKLPEAAEGIAMVRQEHLFEGVAGQPPAAAIDLVRAHVRTASLVQVARMTTVRRVVQLRSAEGLLLAEVDDDEVSVYEGRRVAARFREIEVEIAPETSDDLVAAVVKVLHAGGAGDPDPTPKLVRALGSGAVEPPEVVVPAVDPATATAGDAVRAAIAASVLRLLEHDPGVRIGGHPEDVHQARVATRRLRSDLRTFHDLLDPAWTEPIREELAWLAEELGGVRDAEVLAERVASTAKALPAPDLEAGLRIASQLSGSVRGARRRLLAALRQPRYLALLDALVEASHRPSLLAAAEQPAARVLPSLVAAPWAQLRRAARRAAPDCPDEELHALRIRAKRSRYAAEAAAPVLGKRAATFARGVAALQGVLGEHHDACVAADRLRDLATGPDAFTAGELVTLERAAADRARAEWPAAFAKVDSKRLRT